MSSLSNVMCEMLLELGSKGRTRGIDDRDLAATSPSAYRGIRGSNCEDLLSAEGRESNKVPDSKAAALQLTQGCEMTED